MFLIDITIKMEQVPAEQADELLAGHRAWFTKHFEQGDFLLVGPYKDRGAAGLTVAQAENRQAVEAIIAEDAYYPAMADYIIHEFTGNLIAENFSDFRGK